MKVNLNTTSLYFIPSEELTEAQVTITSETTKQAIYDKTIDNLAQELTLGLKDRIDSLTFFTPQRVTFLIDNLKNRSENFEAEQCLSILLNRYINFEAEKCLIDTLAEIDTKSIIKDSYYHEVRETQGFNFKVDDHYIMEVKKGADIVYRANLYSNEFAPRNEYKTTDLGESNNEYITI